MGDTICPIKHMYGDKESMKKIPGTSYWIKAKEAKRPSSFSKEHWEGFLKAGKQNRAWIDEKFQKKASEQDPNNFDGDGKIPAIENAFSDPIEKKVAYMIATSHEYKKPNVKAALSFVKNYKWEISTAKVSNLQGINKPIIPEKVQDMAKKMKGKTPKPLICINQFHGIRPQTPGKKILMDGHHRLEACKVNGVTEVPIYKGTYDGGAEKNYIELREKTAEHKEEIYKEAKVNSGKYTLIGMGIGSGAGLLGGTLNGWRLSREYKKDELRRNKYRKHPVSEDKIKRDAHNLHIGNMIGHTLAGGFVGANTGHSFAKAQQAAEDFKNTYGNYNRHYRTYNTYNRTASKADVLKNLKTQFKNYNVDLDSIKTKIEFNKTYRNLAKQYHPDINKAPDAGEKMRDINDLADKARTSDWYEKLAKRLEALMEKTAKTLAVDFDGTLFESDEFPKFGKPKQKVIDYVKKRKAAGDTIILWTCRNGESLAAAKKALKEQEVPIDHYNENPDFSTGSPKIYADEYLDDRAVNVEKVAYYKIKDLKKHQAPLTSEELKLVMDRKAVWHMNGGAPSPAVWKSKGKDGKVIYITNTHRAAATAPTLKGAIGKFHNFIKSTASEAELKIEKTASEQILYHASPVQDIKKFKRFEDTSGNNKGKIIFATPQRGFAAAFGVRWNDGTASLEIKQKGGKKNAPTNESFDKAVLKITGDIDIDKPASMYKLKGNFKEMRYLDDVEQYTDQDVEIVSEEKYKTFRDMAKENGVEIRNISDKYIDRVLKKRKSIEKAAKEK